MKKILTIISACLLATSTMAQDASTPPTNPSSPTSPTSPSSPDSLQALTDSIARMQQRISLLQAKCDELEQQQEALQHLSSVIYKQCLLYPLETRYSAKGIQEAITCLNELSIWDNPLYKADCDVYRPMLTNYARYNSSLMEIVEHYKNLLQQKQQLMESYRMTRGEASWIADDLRQMEYYQYYSRRNNPPYKSIIYLDDTIDSLINLIENPQNITVQALDSILERLRPRQN